NLYQQPANGFVAGFIGTPSMNFLEATIDGDKAGGDGYVLTLNASRREVVGGREQISIGVRPEHLHLAGNDDPACHFSGTVEVVEPLGAVTLIQVKVGERTLTAQIEPHQQ